MSRKLMAWFLCFTFLFQQTSFAQVAAVELNLAGHLARMQSSLSVDKFRPLHLRYFSYDSMNDKIRMLLDQGDQKDLASAELQNMTKELLNYFLIGVTLPNDTFWVNLRPDSEDQIIDNALAQTDIGKIMLEADLQLKKDTASYTSPQTPEGKEYWNRIYKKTEEIYGYDSVTIPTLTRPWIVPNEVIVREAKDSAYVYKATLKVMLEQDYLKDSAVYSFKDARAKALNDYSSELIRELIIPKLIKEVNTSKKYAALRQVFYSLIMSRWFKSRFNGQPGTYASLINTSNLTNLTSKTPWSKGTFFNAYRKSFTDGEYNIKEQAYTPTGQVIRTYFSGGINVNINPIGFKIETATGMGAYQRAGLTGVEFGPGPAGVRFNRLENPKAAIITSSPITAGSKVSVASPITVPLIAVDNPDGRVVQIAYLLREIDKELANPGTSDLPKIAVIGDSHGDAGRFVALLGLILNKLTGFTGTLDPNISIESQLNSQGLSLRDLKHAIYFNGDILDRGPDGLKVYFMLQELLEKTPGRVFFNIGNHDLWASGNLVGVHLPWRSNKFNFYGDTQAENLWREKTKSDPERFDTPQALLWWTGRLAEYNAAQEKFQNEFLDGKAKALREEFLNYYKKYSGNWNNEQLDAMENFMGNFARIDVPDPYVGLRGMGKTSTDWWKRLQQQLLKGREARRDAGAADDELAVWQKAISIAVEITQAVASRSEAAKANGDWTYQIFESINNQAYTSLEWWCKDWSSHDQWGIWVIKELNEMIANPTVTNPLIQKDREEFKGEKVTQANYIRSHTLQALGEFYRTHANYFIKSPYADLVSHSWFPVQKDGKVVINYKGKTYTGDQIYDGLRAVSADIKANKNPQDAWEALNLVNKWYADTTTTQKPRDEKKYRGTGIGKINFGIGIMNWFTGHNPLNKLKVPVVVQDGSFAHVQIDKGMAARFGHEGGFALIGPQGITYYGFESDKSTEIVESPDTIIASKVEGEASTVIKNPPVPAKEFLTRTKAALENELLSEPRLNFADATELKNALQDIVEVTPGGIEILDPTALRNELIDKLVYDATFNPNKEVVSEARKLIKDIAATLGIRPASVYDLYLKKGKDSRHYTIPAINLRGMAYNSARAVFKSAVKNDVTDPFILEIAKSEIGYTAQRPAEYTTSMLAAAIKEGYNRPIYLQGDHFQIALKDYQADPLAAIAKIKSLIREAIEAGFYHIDLDMSTLVDWSKPTASEQQKTNFVTTAELTMYVRQLERELGLDKQGIVVNLGGEIGEIGMGLEKGKERNSSIEDLNAFMFGYTETLTFLSQQIGYELKPITKIAVQTGTKHGGVRDSTGRLVRAKVGFNTLAELGKQARNVFGLAGVVQHGASTLPEDYFIIFAGNKMPEGLSMDESLLSPEGQATLDQHPVAEVHLATAYQDTTIDHPEFPSYLLTKIRETILKNNPPKEGQDPNKVFVDNRKNAWGMFKLQTWNMYDVTQAAIRASLEKQFDAVFKNLGEAKAASSAMAVSGSVSMAQTLFGGNWKNRKQQLPTGALVDFTEDGIRQKAREFKNKFSGTEDKFKDAGLVLFVEDKWVKPVAEELSGTNISVGVQSLFFGDPKNPEDFSPERLQAKIDKAVEMGARLANVGHSMHRKGGQGLTNEQANKIMKAILADGRLIPWYTIEITTEDEEISRREIEEGINVGLAGISEAQVISFPITPEPSFKISTAAGVGVVDTSIKVSAADTAFLARLTLGALESKYGHPVAVNSGYGASVKGENAREIFSGPLIRNALIGGASLEAEDYYATVENGMKGKASSALVAVPSVIDTTSLASSSMTDTVKRGGIDFRNNAMNIKYETLGSFAGLDFSLPKLSQSTLAGFDLEKESTEITRMIDNKILPSADRIKEFIAVSQAKGELDNRRETVIVWLAKMGIIEESECCTEQSSNAYKEALVIADSVSLI